jgi:DNA-binding NarL/FixJ family response regulator
LVSLLVPLVAQDDIGEADSVECAVACIRDESPVVVILDLKLSTGTGLDILDAIRGVTPRPRFIVLTNYAEPEVRDLCLTSGADYFLDKSRDFDRVLEVVGELVHSGRI